jgi:hypothetical protein
VFGVFASGADVRVAAATFRNEQVYPVRFVTRSKYQTFWRRALGDAAAACCFGGD